MIAVIGVKYSYSLTLECVTLRGGTDNPEIMISDRIKALREQKGLTQSMLARKLGITRSSVNAWELDDQDIHVVHVLIEHLRKK